MALTAASHLSRWALAAGIGQVAVVVLGVGTALSVGLGALSLLLGGIVFVALALIQQALERRRDWHSRLASLNRVEIDAIGGVTPLHGPVIEPPPRTHPYADDLEIFESHGLYSAVNRAITRAGRMTLADWLCQPAAPPAVALRQQAARDLASHLEHRHGLAAHALPVAGDVRAERVSALMVFPPAGLRGAFVSPLLLFLLPTLTLAAGFGSFATIDLLSPFLALVAAQTVLQLGAGRQARQLARLLEEAEGATSLLDAYSAMLALIERERCTAERLRELQQQVLAGALPASQAIRRLARLIALMDLRNSLVHGLLNALVLWDLHLARAFVGWLERFSGDAPRWLDVLGEWEALGSLAALSFNHPGWAWPSFDADMCGVRAEGLGHPLIADDERVPADLRIEGPGQVWIVTGPNMAGKSTLLRAVGVNLALAHAGGPVCAERLRLSPLYVVSSMRASDSLHEGVSLFYAELQRLRLILDAIDAGRPVFFLIDEMLKGTNTLDRHAGAVALVRQLSERGVQGIVATHDVHLADLASERPSTITNHHFDGKVLGRRLVFDYRLRDGPCTRMNALSLMKLMGIDLDSSRHPRQADAPSTPPVERVVRPPTGRE